MADSSSNNSGGLCIGIDVGGTKILGVVANPDDGAILASTQIATPKTTGPAMAEAMGDVVAELLTGHDGTAIGVGLPGLVDRSGVLRYGPNVPGVLDFEVGPVLTARFGLPVAVENDGYNTAVAEHRHGAARRANDAIIATLGTGVGGAFLVGGRLIKGANGFAGEPGHMLVNADYFPCPCGQLGCWESLASGTGLANIARGLIGEGAGQRVLELAGGEPAHVRGEHVSAAMAAGDPDAAEMFSRFSGWVIRGLGSLISILDPEIVVIGGGLSQLADDFLMVVQDGVMGATVGGAYRPAVPVVAARFGAEAGALGAALNAYGLVASSVE